MNKLMYQASYPQFPLEYRQGCDKIVMICGIGRGYFIILILTNL